MTEEQKQLYLDSGGVKCPYCDSEDISAGGVNSEEGIATQSVECFSCWKTWTDIYTLTGVEE